MRWANIIANISIRFIHFIVGLLANVMNILVSLIIIMLNVYVSWNHTLELFHEAGFKREGYMDIAGVCAVELTFLLGSCHVIGARVKGRKPGWGSILTGALGVGLIMWSNIRAGADYGITGVIIGIAVPLSIILCETILADAWRSQGEPARMESGESSEATADSAVVQTPSMSEAPQTVSDVTDVSDNKPDKTDIASDNLEKESDKPDSESDGPEKEPDTSDSLSDMPILVAKRLTAKEGKLPSIRRLAEEAGISRYQAQKIIKQLKEQIREENYYDQSENGQPASLVASHSQ